MISKEARERDKAVCDAATPGPWWQGDSDEAPRVGAYEGGAIGDDRLGSAYEVHSGRGGPDEWIATEFRREEDARFAAAARNRLPLYIADAEEMDRRIAAAESRIERRDAKADELERAGELTSATILRSRSDGAREALRILRGEA